MAGKVYLAKSSYEADYKVYLIDSWWDNEVNAELIKGCKLVTSPSSDAIKVYIVKYSGDAQIKIMRKNFPKI